MVNGHKELVRHTVGDALPTESIVFIAISL